MNVVRNYPSVAVGQSFSPIFFFRPMTPKAGDRVTFQAFVNGATAAEVVEWEWRFSWNTSGVKHGQVVRHTFSRPGNYTVTLIARHESGASAERSLSIRVAPDNPPEVDLHVTPDEPVVGDSVTLSALSLHDPDGEISNVTWQIDAGPFDDDGEKIEHTFLTPGHHNVTLKVKDDGGNVVTVTETVRVEFDPVAWVRVRLSRALHAYWLALIGVVLGVVSVVLGIWSYRKRNANGQ
jgi:PKD repeat protein